MSYKCPKPGIWVPTVSFFKNKWNADPDLVCFTRHLNRLAEAGVKGFILNSYFGEGSHLRADERRHFLQAAVEVCNSHGLQIISEVNRDSLWETVEGVEEASEGGASYAIINVPRVYDLEMTLEDVFRYISVLVEFITIPIIVRAPLRDSKLAFDFDFVKRLRTLPKVTSIIFPMGDPSIGPTEAESDEHFAVFITYPGDLKDSHKVCMSNSVANMVPEIVVQMYEKYRKSEQLEMIRETGVFREIGARVVALKYAMTKVCGYGGTCRPPLPVPSPELRARVDPILPSLAAGTIYRRWPNMVGLDQTEPEPAPDSEDHMDGEEDD